MAASMSLSRLPRRCLNLVAATLCLFSAPKAALALDPGSVAEDYLHRAWTIADGLPNNGINVVTQTPDGYLWIGTWQGLVRFDGIEFKTFTSVDGLQHDWVESLQVDQAGTLWIGTRAGLHRYRDGRISAVPKESGPQDPSIRVLLEDSQGVLWVGTHGGLYRYQNDTFTHFGEKEGLVHPQVRSLAEGPDGTLWVGTMDGLHAIRDGSMTQVGRDDGLAGRWVTALAAASDGTLYIGTNKGLVVYQDENFKQFSKEDGLSGTQISELVLDRDGNLFIGTFSDGLTCYYEGEFHIPENEHFAYDSVSALFEDQQGNLWVGTSHQGVHRYRTPSFWVLDASRGLKHEQVRSVYQDKTGTMWVGTFGGGLHRIEGEGATARAVPATELSKFFNLAIVETPEGEIWFTSNDGMIRYREGRFEQMKQGLSDQQIMTATIDARGTLWASVLGGVAKLEGDAFTLFSPEEEGAPLEVVSLVSDKDGTLWVASFNRGLFRLQDGALRSVGAEMGVPGQVLYAILEDSQGELWLSTARGLALYRDGHFKAVPQHATPPTLHAYHLMDDQKGNLWLSSQTGLHQVSRRALIAAIEGASEPVYYTSFDTNAGLKSPSVWNGYRDPDGRLHFATDGGLVTFNPEGSPKATFEIPVSIEAIVADGEPIVVEDGLSLDATTSRLELHYVGVNLAAPEKVIYRYMLEGFDSDWVEAGAQRTAYYTNLDPGTYRFRVAASSDGVSWSSASSVLAFEKRPYFYQTRWFQILVVLVALSGVLMIVRMRERRIQVKQARLERYNRQLQDEVAAQTEEIRELDKQKTAFFQNVSHELRTPLTLILNPLESQSRAMPDNLELGVAVKNSRRLLRLVNQLLDFQKLDAGKKKLQLSAINLNRFLYICGDYFRSACSTKGTSFRLVRDGQPLVGDENPIWVMGEIDALEKIAFNYLSNALKYTPSGGEIVLGLQTHGQTARLFVRDTGPGIDEAGQAKLFQVFSQVDGSASRAFEGSGLGLALAKTLAEEMHGQVGVDSRVGEGSTFWFELPLGDAPSDEEDVAFEVKAWLLDDAQGETGVDGVSIPEDIQKTGSEDDALILVVDDLVDMRNLIAETLRRQGYRVATASNGKQGRDVATEIQPDLIISDWMMPQMTGPEMIQAIKASDVLGSVPVILLTAKSDEESKLLGTEVGADCFLGKPFNEQELCSVVRNLLSLKVREREVEELNHMLTETVLKRYISPALVDKIISGELSMDKPAEMRKITVLFSDLSGFTKTSEALGPQGISDFLNEYLTKMNEIIFEHGGTIDKFIGDAIMVMFGAPQDISPEAQAKGAAACALAMQEAMEPIVNAWADRGAGQLRMRIGLHQGDAVVGNFGSDRRSDYTCIGPTVNLAARIESAGEPGRVYVSQAMQALLEPGQTEEAGEFELKGIQGASRLYRLVVT